MIPLDTATQQAQAKSVQWPRDFLELRVRDNDDNPVSDFMWSGVEDVPASVIDPFNGDQREYTWMGTGAFVQMGPISRTVGLTISTVTISLSAVADRVNDLIRSYNIKYGTVIVYRGFIDSVTGNFVAPARCRFIGEVSHIEFTDSEGGEGGVDLICKNIVQDATRTNPATRSDAYQRVRNSDDTFRKYTVAMAKREIFWGKKT